ncbi:hypothetical protein [Thermoactinospora rubra]|uniref:hypothetical protein n=1 Tax=Thermoactinospora rubra TaxID=1088767 RepID=UPI000A1063C6|nr:hypothetical protein [Thermoactinospora rubra]
MIASLQTTPASWALLNSRVSSAPDAPTARGFVLSTLQKPRTHGGVADTGWEPADVYRHLERLERLAADAGIPIRRVATGNLRDDALDPEHRFVSMPLFVLGKDGSRGMLRRQCTNEYKISCLKAEARRLLGYPHPARVPDGVHAEQAIGISVDEFHRAKDANVRYLRNVFPLIDLGWTRADCRAYLTAKGMADTPRSACIGCPYRRDAEWLHLKTTDPDGWADALAFDAAIRHGHPRAPRIGATYYLHRSRRPLSEAVLSPGEDEPTEGCSPWACRGDDSASASSAEGAS